MVVCLRRGAYSLHTRYGPADASVTPSSLAPVNSRMVYLSAAGLPRLFWKRPLNGCSNSSSSGLSIQSKSTTAANFIIEAVDLKVQCAAYVVSSD